MTRRSFVLPRDRAEVLRLVHDAPEGTRATFTKDTRTAEQNDLLHGLLTDISRQADWHGITLHKDDWKLVFMEALNREMRLVPNMAGNGFVNLGRSSSRLTKDEFSQLITLIIAFGDQRGVKFKQKPMPEDIAA